MAQPVNSTVQRSTVGNLFSSQSRQGPSPANARCQSGLLEITCFGRFQEIRQSFLLIETADEESQRAHDPESESRAGVRPWQHQTKRSQSR